VPEEPERKELQPLLLKDLVRQVRKDLLDIVEENRKTNTESIFVVESLTLEVNVTVGLEQSVDGKAGANLYVVDLSSKAKRSSRTEHVHKVVLNLSALAPRAPESPPVGGGHVIRAATAEDIMRKYRGKLQLDHPAGRNPLEKLNLDSFEAGIKAADFPNEGVSLE
jgi:hypothetical protein